VTSCEEGEKYGKLGIERVQACAC